MIERTFIEKMAEALHLIPRLPPREDPSEAYAMEGPRSLCKYPQPKEWNDFTELDPQAYPNRVERHYSLVPTTCFNCESACGLLAYVDKESGQVRKFEGNPHHPGSRGRNCAKGPATINQIQDTERILHPLRRVGARGSGAWQEITWDEALDEIAEKIRTSLKTGAKDRVVYHVGRPGHEGYGRRTTSMSRAPSSATSSCSSRNTPATRTSSPPRSVRSRSRRSDAWPNWSLRPASI